MLCVSHPTSRYVLQLTSYTHTDTCALALPHTHSFWYSTCGAHRRPEKHSGCSVAFVTHKHAHFHTLFSPPFGLSRACTQAHLTDTHTLTHAPGKQAGAVGQELHILEIPGIGGVGSVRLLLFELLGNAPLSVNLECHSKSTADAARIHAVSDMRFMYEQT